MVKKVLFKLVVAIMLFNCSLAFSQQGGYIFGMDWGTPAFAANGQVTLYQHPSGGYLYGVNNDPNVSMDGVAQGYDNQLTDIPISDIYFLVGFKKVVNQSSKLIVTLYDTDPNGATDEYMATCKGPGTSYASGEMLLKDVYASTTQLNYNMISFDNPVNFTGQVIAGIDYSELVANGDGFGLFCDAVGSGLGLRLAFHHADGAWYPTDALFSGSTINNNIAIFPVIADGYVDIKDQKYIFNTKAMIYPNPARDNATLKIDFKNEVKNATIEIIDSKGAVCKSFTLENLNSGMNEVNLDLSDLKSGIYSYSIDTHNYQRYIKKFSVVK